MKRFEIRQKLDDKGTCVIFSVNYRSPLEFIEEIEQELRSTPLCQKVVFDLLLSNGMTSNRYFEASFNGKKLENIRKCTAVDNDIKEVSHHFYQQNSSLLNNGILVNQQKFIIRNGCRP